MAKSLISDNKKLVTFKVLIDGEDITTNHQIVSIDVKREINKVASATLKVMDGGVGEAQPFQAGNAATFLPGKEILIKAGYQSQDQDIFKGIIIRFGLQTDQEGSFLIIDCKHPSVKLTIGRKNEVFNEKKDSEVINSILQNAGLSKEVESTDNQHPELVQHYMTDWDFILMRADLNGLIVLPEVDKIAIKKPKLDASPDFEAVYGSSILRFEAEIDARNQLKSVLGFSWDGANQELVEAKGNPKGEEHPGNIKAQDLAKVIDLKEFNYQTAANIPMAVLDTITTAKLTKAQLSYMRGRMTILGESEIHPGQLIQISGLSDRFNGKAFIGGITHSINSESWETECRLGLDDAWYADITPGITPFPTSGITSPISGLSTGIVKQIHEDPDGNYRILVSIPTLKKDNLKLWARLSNLFASKEIGAFFYPELDDEVVLGFLNEDPHNPIILGMLYSKQNKPPLEPADGNQEKAIISREKLTIHFQEEDKSIIIKTPAENQIVLHDKEEKITISDQHDNVITLSAEGISLKSPKKISLEADQDIEIKAGGSLSLEAKSDVKVEGMNTSLKGKTQLKAEGATAEVSGSSQTTIKGGIVMIN